MAQKHLPSWRRNLALPKARRTVKRTPECVYVRITAGRHAGAPLLGSYQGATEAEADAAMEADEAGLRERYNAIVAGLPTLSTIAGLLAAWERSADFGRTQESTRKNRGVLIKSISGTPLGKASASILRQPAATGVITKWRDSEAATRGPRAADARIEVLNAALNWHVRQGNITRNPAAGIPDVCVSDRSDLLWDGELQAKFKAHVKDEIARVWADWPPGPQTGRDIGKHKAFADETRLRVVTPTTTYANRGRKSGGPSR